MAVKIRLSRFGKKNQPIYRIVATDSRNKRDGRYIENLGTYDPAKHEVVQFNQVRVDYWASQGAVITDAVKKIQKTFEKKSSAAPKA